MEWKAFLEETSDRLRLTPEQGEVFLARLADKNAKASEAKIATQLNMSVAAVKKHMNAITSGQAASFRRLQQWQVVESSRSCGLV
jgi:predicted ArsR family transcriptional regulator